MTRVSATKPQHWGLLEKLKDRRAELASIRAHVTDDDDPRDIAVPNTRKRWERIKRVLDDLNWTRVELLDKKGGILNVHIRGPEDDSPTAELEDLPGLQATGRAAELGSVLAVCAHWLLKAQEVALTRQEAATMHANETLNKMVDSTVKRFELMDKQNQDLLEANHAMRGEMFEKTLRAMHKAQAATETAGEGPLSDAMVEQLLPQLLGRFLDGKPPAAAKNGTPKNGKAA
jgi:hypothetical protein